MYLEAPPTHLVITVLIVIVSAHPTTQCHSSCQCPSQYYVYCQRIGLQDYQLADVISQVPPTAVLLDLSSNHLTKIPPGTFRSLPNLRDLSLAANSITEIQENSFQYLSKLRELTLHRNKITTVEQGSFNDLRELQVLHLGDNRIESLSSLLFANLSTLEKLHLQKNNIMTLSPRTFSGLTNLQMLNLGNNSLQSLTEFTFSGLTTLKTLSLSDNNLSEFSIDAFSGLTHLEELDLERNNITDIVFMYGNDFYLSLTSVTMADNHIIEIPSHVFPHNRNIRHLNLSFNKIRRIGGHSFDRLDLETLTLQKNNMSEINRDIFKDVKRIANLNIAQNRLDTIQTGAFDSFRETLLELDLHGNLLTQVHPGMFRGMRRLRTFNLAANRISVLDHGALQDMETLQELDLSRNNFTTVTSDMVVGPQGLRSLYVACNPLQKLLGFSYDHVDDVMYILTNSTMIDSTPTSAVITWPYSAGTQLYWTLTVSCVNPVNCAVPKYEHTLRPYFTKVTVNGLTPGAEYFICVIPVFLSPDVTISQCVLMRTHGDNYKPSTDSVVDQEDPFNSSSYLSPSLSSMFVFLVSLMFLLLR